MAKLPLSLCGALERPLGIQSPGIEQCGGCGIAGKPLEGDQLQAEVCSLIVGGLDTTAQTCSFTLYVPPRPIQEDSPVLYYPVHVVMQPNSLRKLQTDCDIMLYSSNTAACIWGADLGPFQGKKLLLWAGRSLPHIQRCRRRWLLNWMQLACWPRMPSRRHAA